MLHISKQRVGGITFFRVHCLGKFYVFSFCRTRKRHVIAA